MNITLEQFLDRLGIKTEEDLVKLGWKLLSPREKSKRTVGVGFESEDALVKAYRIIDERDLPYEMELGENALIVPDFVRDELKKEGIQYYEFKIIETAYLNEKGLDDARKEIRRNRLLNQ